MSNQQAYLTTKELPERIRYDAKMIHELHGGEQINNHGFAVGWRAQRNQEIAFWLIEKHKIKQGYRLAYYLKVPVCNDNFTAVCTWVQYQSQRNVMKPATLGELSAYFKTLIPKSLAN